MTSFGNIAAGGSPKPGDFESGLREKKIVNLYTRTHIETMQNYFGIY